jgi:glucose dehydrogenase
MRQFAMQRYRWKNRKLLLVSLFVVGSSTSPFGFLAALTYPARLIEDEKSHPREDKLNLQKLITTVAIALAATALTATAYAQDAKSLAEPGKDWETFHGSYKSWNYSPLSQINTDNVGKLKVAFIQ